MQRLILIVDDDPEVRLLIAETLDAAGFDFYTAISGDEALLTLEEIYPDLLLLDLTMPGVDGWRVIRKVRAKPQMRDLPIVIMSELVGIPNVMSYGVQGNICKPVDPMAMLETLDEVLHHDTVA
jgi:CheY-like chemotaxis protein